MGIEGNDEADSLAKSACSHPALEASAAVYYKDLKIPIRKVVQSLWNNKWTRNINTTLHLIRNDTFEKNTIFRENRKDQVTLTRLRIGHTILTHSHIYSKCHPVNCDTCEVTRTIKHVLTECTKYITKRNKHNIGTNLKWMLNDPITFNRVLNFLEDIDIRQKI